MTEKKLKYNSKIPTVVWLPPQYSEITGFKVQTKDIHTVNGLINTWGWVYLILGVQVWAFNG